MLQAKMAKFTALRGENWLALTTFDVEGRPILTTLRFAKDGDRLYTLAPLETARRIHENAQVEVSRCTERGMPQGDTMEAMAVVLPPDKAVNAKRALSEKYGLAARLSAFTMALGVTAGSYVEITPM